MLENALEVWMTGPEIRHDSFACCERPVGHGALRRHKPGSPVARPRTVRIVVQFGERAEKILVHAEEVRQSPKRWALKPLQDDIDDLDGAGLAVDETIDRHVQPGPNARQWMHT